MTGLAEMTLDQLDELKGRTLVAVNYQQTFEGYDDYTADPRADFIYIPTGALHLQLSDGNSWCIADYNTTKRNINGVGIRRIAPPQTDLTREEPITEFVRQDWKPYIGQEIVGVYFYLQKEEWTHYDHNEVYPESLELKFANGKSVYYFCGDVEAFNELTGRYDLVGGRSSGIVFFGRETFKKYGLHKVLAVQPGMD